MRVHSSSILAAAVVVVALTFAALHMGSAQVTCPPPTSTPTAASTIAPVPTSTPIPPTATATRTRTSTPVPTSTPTKTAVPTSTPTKTSTPVPTSTPTKTSTPVPTVLPSTPTPVPSGDQWALICSTTLDPTGKSQCGSSIGIPNDQFFCDRWVGGFCNDYRNAKTTTDGVFPKPSDAVSLDCLSSTNAGQTSWLPYYVPTNNSDNLDVAGAQLIPFPCGISANEHFMTRMEDGQFGMVVMRQQHPFDFAGRTGHIHFDVDLKTLERRYVRVELAPYLTKMGVDDRNGVPQVPAAFELWFRNGTFQGKLSTGSSSVDLFPPCIGCGPRYYGRDNVRDHVDLYVSRTHVKVVVNGVTEVDQGIQDMGFDRAYVYLQHVNYNSCKAFDIEHYATVAECQLAGNTFHWDNIAFDGPTLPANALTPLGSEDVVFNAWGAASCAVKGVPAWGSGRQYVWQSWVARLPFGTPVAPSDVVCSGGSNVGFGHYEGAPMGLEIVAQQQ